MSTRLIRFEFSAATNFVIEWGYYGTTGYARFFTNRVQVYNGSLPLELTTPYGENDIADLQFVQINDLVYITHPNYPPHRLERVTDTAWVLEEVTFDEPPFLTENLTDTTIEILGSSGTVGATVTLLASAAIFDLTHVDAYWRIGHKAEGAYIEHPITANGSSASLQIYGDYVLRTYGNWGADILIERSLDGLGGWETVANYHGAIPGPGEAGFRNFDAAGTADAIAYYRITIENFDGDSESSALAVLERPEAIVYGYARITAVGSGQSATATVIESFLSASESLLWAEGAWSAYRGYPRACGVHEQRLIFGGTSYQPLTVWGSRTDDFENFSKGLLADDDSYAHTLASTGQAQIQWIISREAMLVGTSLGLWRVRGDGYGATIAPTRVDAKKRDNERVAYVAAAETGAPLVFVGLKNRKLFSSLYREDADRFQNEELTVLSDEITESGVVEMAWQQDKRILWCVTTDGRAIALTYDETQQVVGWHEHITDGDFKSVTTIIGDDDAEDEVWFIVERTIGSETVQYVELLDPDFWTAKEDYFGVDSGLSYDGSPIFHVTGLTHLAGAAIVGLADGVPFEATVDASGEFDLPSAVAPASVIHAGLAYVATLETFRLDADAALGVHIGRTKKVQGVSARFANTWGGKYGLGAETLPIPVPPTKESDDLLGALRPVDVDFSGFQQGRTYDPVVKITQEDPLPLHVLSLTIDLEIESS